MTGAFQNILDQIALLPPDWHGAGTMSGTVLRAVARHAERVGQIHHSAETGSGTTTLVFSQLSEDHTVFALDCGSSISRVKNSELFNAKTVTYVEGPSQVTLPKHVFKDKLQMALIDGPHAYPFPDLEYYYFYPHICDGGLLLIDDINIPTIERMFEIIKSDDMFQLVEVVENTAFFRRTAAPSIDPLGDDWWLQGFNRSHYEYGMARDRSSSRVRQLTRLIPSRVRHLVPQHWKTRILNRFTRS
jgi:hypothetical protein